jgi:Protein of unknown function (DUF3618)
MNDLNAPPATGSNSETATQDVDTSDVAELEADIARTRDELAHTVDQLAAKLDVKTRIRNRAVETKDAATYRVRLVRNHLTDDDGTPTPTALSIGGGIVAAIAAIAAVVLIRLWRRPSRTSSRRRGR